MRVCKIPFSTIFLQLAILRPKRTKAKCMVQYGEASTLQNLSETEFYYLTSLHGK